MRCYGPSCDGTGACSVCGRTMRLVLAGIPGTEVVVRHGPRASPCSGSGLMPAGDDWSTQTARVQRRLNGLPLRMNEDASIRRRYEDALRVIEANAAAFLVDQTSCHPAHRRVVGQFLSAARAALRGLATPDVPGTLMGEALDHVRSLDVRATLLDWSSDDHPSSPLSLRPTVAPPTALAGAVRPSSTSCP